ncbi:aldo/keto reductase [Streptomyces sp. NBC_01477]|uniref:aldo/keto reductase n=1 Tax=Streptomyces sp. NBC_01477 TaxID=2976015 RepID=UPI002E318746|nr:aldo/keto reductase [Streptomyces sp. NBC_01477]
MARGASLRPASLSPQLLAALRGLDGLARRRGQSLAQTALSWALRDARVTSLIIGASSVGSSTRA